MTIRPCLPFPHPCLAAKADPVEAIDAATLEIWQDMVDTMEAMPGVGLAAPQIGISLALAVVDASEQRGKAIYLANPQILECSDRLYKWEEASPNLPGVSAVLKRPETVRVAFTNAEGMRVEREFTGLWSTSVQHQIDHLHGRLYFDHLSRLKRDMLIRKSRKII